MKTPDGISTSALMISRIRPWPSEGDVVDEALVDVVEQLNA
jgi:hypothetical protein